MTKMISLLGSTGSIGRQTLEVVRELGLGVAALTAPGVGDGQVGLVCCSPWGHKELDMTD